MNEVVANLLRSLRLPIAIIGMGKSGQSAQRLLLEIGVPADQILTFDKKSPAQYGNELELMKSGQPKSLCVSPGVALSSPWILAARSEGVSITSELEIAFAFVTDECVIGITGSVGKSTTTALIHTGCQAEDPNAFIGGNFGIPLADYSLNILRDSKLKAKSLVLELSSYQLENFANLKTDISVLTSLNPNHLERYPSLESYYRTKLTLISKTKQLVVVNKNGGDNETWLPEIRNILSPKCALEVTEPGSFGSSLKASKLLGSHNQDNLAMAFAVGKFLNWKPECYTCALEFKGLSHRLENLGTHQGLVFINDSKATAIESVLQAVDSVQDRFGNQVIHLLLGGRDKNLPWEKMKVLGNFSNLKICFFGEVGPKAKAQSQLQGPVYRNLQNCLENLKSSLQKNQVVLLSPGGTSLDEFSGFEERGDFFKRWVLTEFQNG